MLYTIYLLLIIVNYLIILEISGILIFTLIKIFIFINKINYLLIYLQII